MLSSMPLDLALVEACHAGSLMPIVKLQLDGASAAAWGGRAFREALGMQNFQVASVLLRAPDVRAYFEDAKASLIRTAVASGNLVLCQWLKDHCQSIEVFQYFSLDVLSDAVLSRDLPTLEWLATFIAPERFFAEEVGLVRMAVSFCDFWLLHFALQQAAQHEYPHITAKLVRYAPEETFLREVAVRLYGLQIDGLDEASLCAVLEAQPQPAVLTATKLLVSLLDSDTEWIQVLQSVVCQQALALQIVSSREDLLRLLAAPSERPCECLQRM